MASQAEQNAGAPRARLARLAGRPVAVVGAGASGRAAARLLAALGAEISLLDRRPETAWADAGDGPLPQGVRLFGGGRFAGGLDGVDLVVMSPGVPPGLRVFDAVRRRGVPMVGEMELASWMLSMPVIGVTGTNGKSTVVTLLGRMFRESGHTPFVGGNLGPPLAEAALALHRHECAGLGPPLPFQEIVAEASSFQLETIDLFHPRVAVWLNLAPDHLDRYPGMNEYAAAKANLFRNQTADDVALLNADDPCLRSFRPALRGQLAEFSMAGEVPAGAWVDGGTIVTRWQGRAEALMPVRDVPLAGAHNVANVLAAVAAGMVGGCSRDGMRRAVRAFRGLEHTLEVVRERRGVTFINDSKGTNVDATLKALDSVQGPVVVMLGGRDKGRSDFRRLSGPLARAAAPCLVMGEAAEAIAGAVEEAAEVHRVSSLAEGVRLAAALARPGGAVLLSPACASFDMFQDFRDRGRQFRELVMALP